MAKKAKEVPNKLEQEIVELKDLLQRTHADFVNFKARTEKEKSEIMDYGMAETIKMLLPILDNLTRAEAYIPADLAKNEWVQGVLSIDKQFQKTLAEMGIEKINTVGEFFDPHLHEAIACEEVKGRKTNEIIEEFEPGYEYKDKVIRYAKVKIAK